MIVTAKNLSPALSEYNGQQADVIKIYGLSEYKPTLHVRFQDGRELHLEGTENVEQFDLKTIIDKVEIIGGSGDRPTGSQIIRRVRANRANKRIIKRNGRAMF